jgi:hypothetical protein
MAECASRSSLDFESGFEFRKGRIRSIDHATPAASSRVFDHQLCRMLMQTMPESRDAA